ncbi:MAG: nucleoside monophosphate kinase [Candidatus Moranbacteria bacterium]|nr:nucleoside monophosphate kinase [Candidatus Moranbacteria bacterium]
MNLIILGPPGSGKGTQAAFLVKKFNLVHIDIGLALRQTAKDKTVLGKRVNKTINAKQELVPDEIIFHVLKKELKKVPSRRGIILDGAPRRVGQIDDVEKALNYYHRVIDRVIYLNISSHESVRRISRRYQCSRCFARFVLGKDIKNPRYGCPVCQGEVQRRLDDTPRGIRKRLAVFHKETSPVISYFRRKGILVEAKGEKAVDEIFKFITKKLRSGK